MLASESDQLAALDKDLQHYWRTHSTKWETPLRLLDVTVAYKCGELNSILPSGEPSRQPSSEPLLTIGRAVELHDKGEVQVRRRFRNLAPVEWNPRWERAMATCTRLKMTGAWDDIVRESEKARKYESAIVRGEIEDPEAAQGRGIVMSVGAPALKAQAKLKSHFDGGLRLAVAELLETAGETAEERLVTAVLLAEFKGEAEAMTFEARLKEAAASFAQKKAAKEQREKMARGIAVAGVGTEVIVGVALLVALALAVSGWGGNDDSLQSTLDLLQ
jgi:hypothetical protein